jgi:hypothetical protein
MSRRRRDVVSWSRPRSRGNTRRRCRPIGMHGITDTQGTRVNTPQHVEPRAVSRPFCRGVSSLYCSYKKMTRKVGYGKIPPLQSRGGRSIQLSCGRCFARSVKCMVRTGPVIVSAGSGWCRSLTARGWFWRVSGPQSPLSRLLYFGCSTLNSAARPGFLFRGCRTNGFWCYVTISPTWLCLRP